MSNAHRADGWRFLHGFSTAQTAGQGELASLARADGWLNSPPLTAAGSARQSRPGRFLDLHLHQLAAHAALCPRVGREIQGSGAGGDRRARAGVRVREEHRQRAPGRRRTCGSTIRSRSTATMRSGAHSRTSIGRRCISSMRRGVSGIIISARASTSNRRWSSSNCWRRPEPAASIASWCRSMPAAPKLPPIGAA